MGKGDKKSGKGKRTIGSYGNTRKRRKDITTELERKNLTKKVAADKKAKAAAKKAAENPVEVEAEVKKPVAKKAPVKKPAAKKAAAKKED
jgi:ribosomal small subunit protein bTHX